MNHTTLKLRIARNFKNMSLLTMIFITSLQASNSQIVDSNEIEWVRESTPKYAYTIKEEIKKAHGKTVEPSINIKYIKNKFNSGINRIKIVVEPVGNEIKTVTETWTDLNPSYLTWDNAMLGAAVIGTIGAGAYAYNQFNNLNADNNALNADLKVLNEDLMNYENRRQMELAAIKLQSASSIQQIQGMDNSFFSSKKSEKDMQKFIEMYDQAEHLINAVTTNEKFNEKRFKEFNEKLVEKDRLAEENYRAQREKSNSAN